MCHLWAQFFWLGTVLSTIITKETQPFVMNLYLYMFNTCINACQKDSYIADVHLNKCDDN